MNGELNFSISPEGLADKGKEIQRLAKVISDALADINAARSSLEGWVSTNKDRYEERIVSALPKMNELVDTINSYSRVAIQTSERVREVENRIAKSINDNLA